MKSTLRLRTTALAVLGVLPFTSFAAGADTFMNGQSFYGQPANGAQVARVIELETAKLPNISYGETVKFVNDRNQSFTWTFNGLDQRAVRLSAIAPVDFDARSKTVYVGRNPSNRR